MNGLGKWIIQAHLVHPALLYGPIFIRVRNVHIVVGFISCLLVTATVLIGKHLAENIEQNCRSTACRGKKVPRDVVSVQTMNTMGLTVDFGERVNIPGLVLLLPHERASKISDGVGDQNDGICRDAFRVSRSQSRNPAQEDGEGYNSEDWIIMLGRCQEQDDTAATHSKASN